MTAPETVNECRELHCSEEHSATRAGYDALSEVFARLIEAVHSRHDSTHWKLCTREICRDTAYALGVRR